MNKYMFIGAVVAGLGVVYMLKKGVDKAGQVLQPINPFNNDNIINQGATGIYQAITGSAGSIGGDFYDATHGGMLSNGTFNPTSDNNLINRGVGALGEAVTGETGWTLGGQIYDWTH